MATTQSWVQKLLKIEPGISLYQWVADRIANNWQSIVTLVGATGMTGIASITEWVQRFGPFGLALAFMVSFLMILLIRIAYESAAMRSDRRRSADSLVATGRANVLDKEFKRVRVSAADFFNTYHLPNKDKKFDECEVLGPSNIFLNKCTLFEPVFSTCQFVLLKPNPVDGKLALLGVVAFDECTFIRTKFIQCTFFLTEQDLASLRAMQNGKDLHLITYEAK